MEMRAYKKEAVLSDSNTIYVQIFPPVFKKKKKMQLRDLEFVIFPSGRACSSEPFKYHNFVLIQRKASHCDFYRTPLL